jgi:hypothetical protein
VYSRTWDWYPGRGRTPEKLGDVSDVKKGGDLLPVHFFSQITGIVRDHRVMVSENFGVNLDHISVGPGLATQRSLRHTGAEISQDNSDDTRTRLGLGRRQQNVHVVDVHVVMGAIDHGDHGDHCLRPILIVRLIS